MTFSKQIAVFITQIFLCAICFAQREKIDSVKKVLVTAKDTQRINCLNTLSKLYQHKQKDTASVYASMALKESKEMRYLQGMGDANFNMGKIEADRFAKEKYYSQAIFFYQNSNNVDALADVYQTMFWMYWNEANFNKSIEALTNAEALYRKAKDSVNLGITLTFLGLVYGSKGDFVNAFKYGFQALDVRKKTNDTNGDGVLWALSNIGRLFQEVEDYTTAIDYYMQAYDYAEKHNIDWVYFKDKIAECYWLMNRNDSALYFAAKSLLLVYKDSIALKRRLDDPQSSDFKKEPPEPVLMAGIVHLIHHDYDKALKNYLEGIKSLDSTDIINAMRFLPFISKTYFEKGDYKNALLYSQKLLRLAENKGAMQYIRDATKQLWQIYDRIKVVDSSYKYYQQYTVMKDSVDNYKFLSQLTSFKQAAANEKKELQFQQQLEQESFTKKILVISIIVVVMIGVFVFRFISLKRKNEAHQHKILQNELEIQKLEGEKIIAELQQQKTELEMQALRAQMNPHFIFNSLNSINRFILKKQSSEATEYLTKFSRLIRMILNNSVSTSISLADDLEALQLYLELERLRCEEKFSFKINCDPDLDIDFIQVPPMLLQPFVENAIWHGLMNLPDRQAGLPTDQAGKEDRGHLSININQEDSTIICTITDDGVGRKKASELKDKSGKHKSMGMKITESRIAMMQKMNGENKSIEIKDLVYADGSAAGTEVVLRIPVVQ